MKRLLTIILIALGLGTPHVAAQNDPEDRRHTVVEIFTESATVAPGKPFTVALQMTPEPGWHTYWINPGDAGMATTIKWEMPEGFTAGEIQYPAPETIPFSGLVNYGYGHENALLVTITPPAQLPEGRLNFTANAVWLVCDDEICVPEEDKLSFTLTKGDGAVDAASQAYFNAARAALPAEVNWPAKYKQTERDFALFVPMPLESDEVLMAHFFPASEGVIDYASPQRLRSVDGGFVLSMAGSGILIDGTLRGVLVLQSTADNPKEAFAITAEPGKVPAFQGRSAGFAIEKINLATALLFALVGGMILNLMPCVFPVLSLKALSLAKTGGDEHAARESGLYYTLGILVSFGIVGGALLIVRSTGAAIGWGFQLQSPAVVGILALLMFSVSLNLFGFFEIGGRLAGAGNDWISRLGGKSQAFATGALATVVATPCTAPLMAPALAFALSQSAPISMAIFLSLGLGLALPFLAIAYIPALRNQMPKPGAWMQTFKQFLGFPMILTALWLLFVLGNQVGLSGVIWVLAGFILIAFAIWAFHQAAAMPSGQTVWRVVGIAAIIFAVSSVVGTEVAPGAKPAAAQSDLNSEPYDEAALQNYIQAGEPVFLYFTADWCITCKWNEKTSLKTEAVSKAFEKAGVKVMVGDWTNRDDRIAEALKTYGRVGVPLYVYYRPGADQPEVLGQVLTVGTLTNLVADRL